MKDGWQERPLGEVAQVIAGQSPKGSAYNSSGSGVPFYQGKKEFGEKFIGEPTTWTTQTTKLAVGGDVLMSVRAPVGPVNFATEECCIGRGLAAIRGQNGLNKDFLFYFFLWKQDEISGKAGAVFRSISKTEIEQIRIPYPPQEEQQRIVAILDKAFAAIATAKANTEKNLLNARAMIASHLDSIFLRQLERGRKCLLADCLSLITYGFTNPMPTTEKGPFMVTAKNVVAGKIDYASARHTSQQAFEDLLTPKSRPQAGDVLLTKDGTLGRVAVVEKADLCINQSVALLRGNGRMNPYFLKHLLSSPAYQHRMIGDADGTTIKHIYITRVDKMQVPCPSVTRQSQTVADLDAVIDRADSLIQLSLAKLAKLDRLRDSLLHNAFVGML